LIKVTATISDEVKEVTKGIKHNEAAGTGRLYVQSVRYGGNELKYKMTEIVMEV
jgi:hypothetical protein